MTDANGPPAGRSDTPPGGDFLARRTREKAELRAREEQDRKEYERLVLTPQRDLRPEWDAAWAELWHRLTPVWGPWEAPPLPGGKPDIPAVGASLKQVGAAIDRRDAVPNWVPSWVTPPPADVPRPPDTLRGRLAWVEDHAVIFDNEVPVAAVALIVAAITQPVEAVTERVGVLLNDPDWRPAVGWMRFIPACLWPRDTFPTPPDPVECVSWPPRWRAHIRDCSRLTYLLYPRVTRMDMDTLFPPWRGGLRLPPAGSHGAGEPAGALLTWAESPETTHAPSDVEGSGTVLARPSDAEPAVPPAEPLVTPADHFRRLAGLAAASAAYDRVRPGGGWRGGASGEAVKAEHWERVCEACERFDVVPPAEPDVGTPAQLRNALAILERWCRDTAARLDGRSDVPPERADRTPVVGGQRPPRGSSRRKSGRPSQDRQNDIVATILDAGTPLTRPELIEAMRRASEGKLGHHLAWMVRHGVLVNIPGRGYWPASASLPR